MKQDGIGLQYMIELGIKPFRTTDALFHQLIDRIGKEKSTKLIKLIHRRGIEGNSLLEKNSEFYDEKNKNFQTSMMVSGAFDGNIHRKACNWIDQNKPSFGSSILEIGCDCGIITCFIARAFPDSRITAIDRCEGAIHVAKELAVKLKINNITFLHADLADIQAETFDTVFSMRTMHENTKNLVNENLASLFMKQVTIYKDSVIDYAKTVASSISDNGHLISIERVSWDPLFMGWLMALNDCGVLFDKNRYQQLICREIEDEEACFQAMVAQKGQKLQTESLIMQFIEIKKFDRTLAEYRNWEASVMLQFTLQHLILGYHMFDESDVEVGKMALWTRENDETAVIFDKYMNCQQYIAYFDISQKEEIIETIHNILKEMIKNQNIKVKTMHYEDEEEIIGEDITSKFVE